MADGEEEEELEVLQGVPWPYHLVRQFLLEKLIADEIPGDYQMMGPQYVAMEQILRP